MSIKHQAVGRNTRHRGLTLLGKKIRAIPTAPDQAHLETFINKYPQRNYGIHIECPEFTALCPITGQPDFGVITIDYVPNRSCIESKSLKLYLHSFRNVGAFYEETVNRILDDVIKACLPLQARVTGTFNPRGGITITVKAEHPPPP